MFQLPPPAGPTPAPSLAHASVSAAALLAASQALLPRLIHGAAIGAPVLREAMTAALGGTDAEGAWSWKNAYEACEVAQLLFLRRFGPALRARSITAQLGAISKVAGLLPTHTRRSEESQAFQQFSTPLPLGLVAAQAAALTPADIVLEPSAGTGLLAVFAELVGAELALNELADTRADLLALLFPAVSLNRVDAARIHDHLDADLQPSVVLMNPPFSVGAHVEGRVADATYRHIASALARLAEGGRLVAITGASFSLDNPSWAEAFARLQQRGRVAFSAVIDHRVFAKHGTTVETRLTVIDRVPATDPACFSTSLATATDVATLLALVEAHLPPRQTCTPSRGSGFPTSRKPAFTRSATRAGARPLAPIATDAVELPTNWSRPPRQRQRA